MWRTLVISMSVSACATTPPAPMTYDQCEAAKVCTVRGLVTTAPGEHGKIARLDLLGGRCINVSLPIGGWNALKASGPIEMTITGDVYDEPVGEGGTETILEINGRRIGYGRCGYFFVFVPDGR